MRTVALRAFEAVVLALALYALVAVPLGRRTGWGHLVAIFTTPVAKEAAADVTRAFAAAWASRADEHAGAGGSRGRAR